MLLYSKVHRRPTHRACGA